MPRNDASILVVDDEPIIRKQLSRALHSVGLACDCAVDGDDALQKVAGHRYAMVITDLRMPERNGHALAVELLHQVNRPRIVALTGVIEPRLADDLIARGVDEVVFKPVNYFDFATRMKRLLKGAQAAQEIARGAAPAIPAASNNLAANRNNASEMKRQELETRLLQSPPGNDWVVTALRWIDWYRFPNPTEELRDFLQRLSRSFPYDLVSDRRRAPRIKMHEVAVALSLDEHQRPAGAPFKLLVRDLSPQGIGLVHSKPLSGRLGLVWNTRAKDRVVVECDIVRCQGLGEFFDIGGVLRPPRKEFDDPPPDAEA